MSPILQIYFLIEIIDRKIFEIASKLSNSGINPLHFMKRFLDDIFQIFLRTTKELHIFLEQINNIHPNIKFKMSHTTPSSELKSHSCTCQPQQSIQFLDRSCKKKEGRIIVDLYRKPTDRNQYMLTSSCHPTSQTENIPFSLAMRIVRVCTEPDTRDLRLQDTGGQSTDYWASGKGALRPLGSQWGDYSAWAALGKVKGETGNASQGA